MATDQLESVFLTYQQAFDFFGIPAVYLPAGEALPYEAMRVLFQPEPAAQALELQLAYSNDILTDIAKSRGQDAGQERAQTLLFMSSLPGQVSPERSPDIAELLMTLNRLLPIGGFGLSANGEVSYSYSLLTEQRQVYALLVVRIVRMIGFFLMQFGPFVTAVAEGRKSASQAISELEKILSSPPPA